MYQCIMCGVIVDDAVAFARQRRQLCRKCDIIITEDITTLANKREIEHVKVLIDGDTLLT